MYSLVKQGTLIGEIKMSNMQIQERVLELVASLEQYSKLAHKAVVEKQPYAQDLASVTRALALELSMELGKGRLEVSRES